MEKEREDNIFYNLIKNETSLTEVFCNFMRYKIFRDLFIDIVNEKIKLGSDEYFVLGDDRQNSEDSRNANVGNVKYSYIYGKAWFVISPKTHFGFVKE